MHTHGIMSLLAHHLVAHTCASQLSDVVSIDHPMFCPFHEVFSWEQGVNMSFVVQGEIAGYWVPDSTKSSYPVCLERRLLNPEWRRVVFREPAEGLFRLLVAKGPRGRAEDGKLHLRIVLRILPLTNKV